MSLNDQKIKYYFECNICFNLPTEPISTFCGHIFCWPCFYSSEYKKIKQKCPLCRKPMQLLDVIPMKTTNDADRFYPEYCNGVDIPPRPVFYRSLSERNISGEINYKSFGRKQKNCNIVHVIPITKKTLCYTLFGVLFLVVSMYYGWQIDF